MDATQHEVESLSQKLEEVTGELFELRDRVAALEALRRVGALAPEPSTAAAPPEPSMDLPSPEPSTSVDDALSEGVFAAVPLFRLVTLAGRTLVVMGGGFLLRALTDAELIPQHGGVAAGLLYASVWLVLADRARMPDERLSAAFHAFASAVIACPLLVETTLRFHVLSGAVASTLLTVGCLGGAAIASRRSMKSIGWIAVGFTAVTALVLAVGSRDLVPPTIGMLVVAAFVERLALLGRWPGPRWPAALAFDAMLLLIIGLVGREGGLPEGYAPISEVLIILLSTAALAAHLGLGFFRFVRGSDQVGAFDAVQLAAGILVVGLAAAEFGQAAGGVAIAAGLVCAALAIGCYRIAFRTIERDTQRAANFYYFGSAGGVLALAGAHMLFPREVFVGCCFALAVAAAWFGGTRDRSSLRFHGAVFVSVGAIAYGCFERFSPGLVGGAGGPWVDVDGLCYGAAATAAAGYGILAATRRRHDGPWYELLPETTLALWAGWSLACLAARWIAILVAGAPGAGADAGVVAALRTGVLAILAVALAWFGRRYARRELHWLVYPTLAGGALKLLLEDVRNGRPATLFPALALFGGALALAPRLLRSGATQGRGQAA